MYSCSDGFVGLAPFGKYGSLFLMASVLNVMRQIFEISRVLIPCRYNILYTFSKKKTAALM